MGKKLKKKTKKKKIEKNADVEYYTTYPKTPEKRAVNPNLQLCISALIYFFFVQQYGKMKCFYNVTQVTLHFKRWISTLWLLMLLLEVEEGGCGDCSAPLGLV
jgi:hypothetical protein